MAFEKRNKNNTYYYSKQRIRRRVVSTYIGNDECARLCERLDSLKRDAGTIEAERRVEHLRSLNARLAQIQAPLTELETHNCDLTTAALLTNGYHQHKRQWRKKHARKTLTPNPSARVE